MHKGVHLFALATSKPRNSSCEGADTLVLLVFHAMRADLQPGSWVL